jgi:Cd2+/Zn2+-exporting ATPase
MRVIASAVLLVAAVALDRALALPLHWALLAYLPAYFIAGYDVLLEAWEGIREGNPFDEDFLMAVATLGALAIGFVPGGEPEFAEAVFVMLFFQVGELFEDAAQEKSRKSIAKLMDIRPDVAHVERAGEVLSVDPAEVAEGEVVVIRPGERVPMDGVVVEGSSSIDTVALTGESVPRTAEEGDEVVSGCVNKSGVLRVRVSRPFAESTVSRILELVENSNDHKSRSETFIRRFARIYTPAVVVAALLVAIAGPALSGDFAGNFATWLLRALTFLVVSCPCALVISVPLTFFGGVGGASRHGILIKGSGYMEALAQAETVVFDKTGTLTRGVFEVSAVHGLGCEEHRGCSDEHHDCSACEEARTRLLHLAAHVERYSTHPIAEALRHAYPDEHDDCTVQDVQEIAGKGIVAQVNGMRVAVGNARLMEGEGAAWEACTHAGTQVHVAIDGVYAGHIVIADEVKPDAQRAIADLKAEGVTRTVMLTGDREAVARDVATQLGVDDVRAELLPEGKVEAVEQLLAAKTEGRALAFVGDGINDAPVLARADVGIAMGALGSDAAIEAADVVLMDDAPSKVALAMRIAKRTLRIARENIAFAICVKLVILVLAAFGLAPMWLAVFGDVGVMVLAVLNAMRALR